MPPKPKFTKEKIVAAALKIVSESGMESLTARELGAKLGTSARPIFTVFNGMDELQNEVRAAAMARFENMRSENTDEMPIFKQIGMKMVLFGIKEPKLYQLLFMRENDGAASFEDIFGILGNTAEECVKLIKSEHGLSDKHARDLFTNMWIYTFGVGTLCATRVCKFSEKELSLLLSSQFNAVVSYYKSL